MTKRSEGGDKMSDGPTAGVAELRELLEVSHRAELEALEQRVAELERRLLEKENRTVAVGEVMVDAIANEPSQPFDALPAALQPTVISAVHTSAREDSTVLVDALYPVMGPAIRRVIASLFSLDSSRTGRTFRVSQVLLIHRDTGLLLANVGSEGAAESEAEIVGGMLDAIRAFVDEAFHTTEADGLRDLRVGEVSVWVEWGPHAILAAVTRGAPIPQFRSDMAEVLEQVHEEYEKELRDFDGFVEPFDSIHPVLLGLQTNSVKLDASRRLRKAVVLVVVALLVAAAIFLLLVWWIT